MQFLPLFFRVLVAAWLASSFSLAHAQIHVSSAQVTPDNLGLQWSFWSCGGACGIRNDQLFQLSATLDAAVGAGESVRINQLTFTLLELDAFDDDVVQSWSVDQAKGVVLQAGQQRQFTLARWVDIATLNRQCGGGCDTSFGTFAENSALEFSLKVSVDAEALPVPEPEVAFLAGLGAVTTALLARRRRALGHSFARA